MSDLWTSPDWREDVSADEVERAFDRDERDLHERAVEQDRLDLLRRDWPIGRKAVTKT